MELTWYGLSCYRLTERGLSTIVTDPHTAKVGSSLPKLKGDIVTLSTDLNGSHDPEQVTGYKQLITGPGEYEIGGVFIHGISSPRKSIEEKRNTIYLFEFSNVSVAHMGGMEKVPTQTQIDALETVNILIVPVGGNGYLNASKASELVSMIEPNIVIPMLFEEPGVKQPLEPLDKFLKEMGVSEYTAESSLKMAASNLPEETQVIVLESAGK